MESINECFLLEKELRGVVQKGMRGNVGAVEYLEEVRIISEFSCALECIQDPRVSDMEIFPDSICSPLSCYCDGTRCPTARRSEHLCTS